MRGFRERPQQLSMAQTIAQIITAETSLICEAGTGTGKTLAYLVPAVLSKRKVVLSTGTRALQDQLFRHDLPLVLAALNSAARVALLKGRSNYLCQYRLERALGRAARLNRDLRADLSRVRDWAQVTTSGDIAECQIAENASVWPLVTSTLDNCLAQDCPRLNRCHPQAARRQAQEADIVIVNHHLLCANFALQLNQVGAVIPEPQCWIIDEAHQLPEIAMQFFGLALSTKQVLDLTDDLVTAADSEHDLIGSAPGLSAAVTALTTAAHTLHQAFANVTGRVAWQDLDDPEPILRVLAQLGEALTAVADSLTAVAGQNKEWDRGRERCADLLKRLARLAAPPSEADADWVRWVDVQNWGMRLHLTPLDVAPIFAALREQAPATWILTSATMTVGGSFDHFARQMGWGAEVRTASWDSPFDYPRQALWFLPPDMPDPSTAQYTQRVAVIARELITIAQGRTFLLFTSHRALREVAAQFDTPSFGYPLLIQGSAPRAALLDRFRSLGNAVLLGSTSFWEGVDVRGEALSCVIIDKLPFAMPDDPILRAKIAALQRQGLNPFLEYQLPHAVIALKQGAGRLIRDDTDRGLFVVCDPRLLTRRYGTAFFNSLPPMTRTQELAAVRAFMQPPETLTPAVKPIKRRRARTIKKTEDN
nr:ATP-dependent DNA helicase [Thiospirillum jenense]